MYLLVASYHDVDRAEAHFEVLRTFHDVGRLGTYDAAILNRKDRAFLVVLADPDDADVLDEATAGAQSRSVQRMDKQ